MGIEGAGETKVREPPLPEPPRSDERDQLEQLIGGREGPGHAARDEGCPPSEQAAPAARHYGRTHRIGHHQDPARRRHETLHVAHVASSGTFARRTAYIARNGSAPARAAMGTISW
jgi:hypothetical protein